MTPVKQIILDKLVADDNRPGDLQQWQQFKGDPAVRGTLFLQQRIPSRLDENIDSVHETVYLRSASINIMNGMLGLAFSCDGSHYMPVDEFLEKNLGFWIGELAADRQ